MPQVALVRSSCKPSRGGHAPGDIRHAFLRAISAFYEWTPRTPEPVVRVRGRAVPLSEVCGLLWNCTDTLPSAEREEMVAAMGPFVTRDACCATYAQAARAMRQVLGRHRIALPAI